jgi:hypothetical protein
MSIYIAPNPYCGLRGLLRYLREKWHWIPRCWLHSSIAHVRFYRWGWLLFRLDETVIEL